MVIQTAIALIFIFAILVMFHELGHYIAARMVGIRVDEFAFGFGPKLIRLFKRGDTEYTIHPFPLGGFVKLAGMEPGEENILDGFQAQAIWKRAIVIFSGPFASFLLAVIVFLALGVFWGYPVGETENKIGMVNPQTEAARVGLRAGDRILSVNGVKVNDGMRMTDLISGSPGKRISLVVERGGGRRTITATPKWSVIYIGAIWSFMNPRVGEVDDLAKGSAADKAGIQPKDRLVSLDGRRITSGQDFIDAIRIAGANPVKLKLKREGKIVTTSAHPEISWVRFMGARWMFPGGYVDKTAKGSSFEFRDILLKLNGKKISGAAKFIDALQSGGNEPAEFVVQRGDDEKRVKVVLTPSQLGATDRGVYTARGLLGFTPDMKLVKAGFVESIGKGLFLTKGMVVGLVQTLTTPRIKDEIGGPIMIAKITQAAVASGPYKVLFLLGALSMSLAFINLVPIPIVDGGHLVILGIEAIRRKRLTKEQMQVVTLIGMAILGMLVITVVWSDLFKISRGLAPQ